MIAHSKSDDFPFIDTEEQHQKLLIFSLCQTWALCSGFIRSKKFHPVSNDKLTLAKGSKAKMGNHWL